MTEFIFPQPTISTFLFSALCIGLILLIPLVLSFLDDLTSPDFINEQRPAVHTGDSVTACSTVPSVCAPSFKYRTERVGVFYVGAYHA